MKRKVLIAATIALVSGGSASAEIISVATWNVSQGTVESVTRRDRTIAIRLDCKCGDRVLSGCIDALVMIERGRDRHGLGTRHLFNSYRAHDTKCHRAEN